MNKTRKESDEVQRRRKGGFSLCLLVDSFGSFPFIFIALFSGGKMSELKAHYFLTPDEISVDNWAQIAKTTALQYYLKDEADRYIAELKQKIDDLETHIGTLKLWYGNAENALHETEETCAFLYKDNDHQKRKRSLAMARWCRTSARYETLLQAYTYRDWYWKWFNKWLALADKFKEKQ